jgi:hypothetical protein
MAAASKVSPLAWLGLSKLAREQQQAQRAVPKILPASKSEE